MDHSESRRGPDRTEKVGEPGRRRARTRLREISVSEAKARLAELLDAVEQGESVVITRHGKAIALIMPEAERRRANAARALATLEEIGRKAKARGLTVKEILSSRHEGHRY